jgi:phosphatidylglycerophosphate synthase
MIEPEENIDYLDKKYHSKYEKSVYVDRALTIPNVLTVSRLIVLPFLVWSLNHLDELGPIPTIAMGFYMFLSDVLDGVLAKALGQISLVGAAMDPVVDKITINTIAIAFAFKGWIPLWAIALILLRDLSILIFGMKIFVNYGTLVTPVFWGRITPLAWGAVFISAFADMTILKWIFLSIAMALTIISGIIYYSRYSELITTKQGSNKCANSQ